MSGREKLPSTSAQAEEVTYREVISGETKIRTIVAVDRSPSWASAR